MADGQLHNSQFWLLETILYYLNQCSLKDETFESLINEWMSPLALSKIY